MFAELDITSNFSFLTGASHPEEYVARAAELGVGALAIADVNSVAGIVRAHVAAREIAREIALRTAAEARDGPIGPPLPPGHPHRRGALLTCVPRLIPAARVVTRAGLAVTVLPCDRAAWGRLARLLTLGRRRAGKGECDLGLEDLAGARRGRGAADPPAAGTTDAGRRGRVAAGGGPPDPPLPRRLCPGDGPRI